MKKIKVRKITLKTGTELILGKDEDSNDELMKKFKGKENIILHTSAPGSPFCVIKKQVFEGDVYAAGILCAKYSQDWRNNKKDVVINVFTGKDISKPLSLKAGTWNVKKAKKIKIKKQDILEFERKNV
ncbi:DUF814 domain-containing protein [Candidatus Pacearchaeota archaeon]|nr:DUF814 domain-containing protein [Candidatus Pacearchaeota archaeon]